MLFDALLLATANRHKYEEFLRLLPCGLAGEFLYAPDVAPLEVEETGTTYAMNALLKAEAWARASGMPSLADDSGIEVEALSWAPGVRSARIVEGGDRDRLQWLVAKMEPFKEPSQRRAHFVAALALAVPGEWTAVCEGSCSGHLAHAPSGSRGFGYDPLFIPDGYAVSFGELPASVKDEISHRASALRTLRGILPQNRP